MGQKVLVFGDIGIDDTLAIIYSYLSDEIDLAGVVADYGNIPRKNAVRTIQYITDLFPTSESQSLQIFAGRSEERRVGKECSSRWKSYRNNRILDSDRF